MDIWPRYFYFSYINVSSITFLDFVPLVCLFVLVPVPHCLKLFYSVLIFGSVCAPVSSLSSSVLGPLYFHIISDPVFQFLLTLKKPSPYTHTHTHTSVGILIRIALKLEISQFMNMIYSSIYLGLYRFISLTFYSFHLAERTSTSFSRFILRYVIFFMLFSNSRKNQNIFIIVFLKIQSDLKFL